MDRDIKSVRRGSAPLLQDERGLSTVEYVVILVLVVAVAIASWSIFGQQVRCALGMANDTMAAGIGVDTTVGPQVCAKGRADGGDVQKEVAPPPVAPRIKMKH